MNRELYIHTLSQFRDECERKHMNTETEAFNAAIQALSADGDLISRQAAIDAAIEAINEWGGGWDAEREARDAINALPSAQPEIIRCKDCKHWVTTWQNDWVKNYHYCPITDGTHRGEWYCADAERRTDG